MEVFRVWQNAGFLCAQCGWVMRPHPEVNEGKQPWRWVVECYNPECRAHDKLLEVPREASITVQEYLPEA
jgi:hypothetical protein